MSLESEQPSPVTGTVRNVKGNFCTAESIYQGLPVQCSSGGIKNLQNACLGGGSLLLLMCLSFVIFGLRSG